MRDAIVNDDLRSYTARNVFGVFTARAAVTGLVAVAIAGTVTVLTFKFGWDIDAAFVAIVVLCVPVGAVGLMKMHGLNSEKWIPLAMEEKAAPQEMVLEPVSYLVERDRAKPSRAAVRAESRREKRVAREVADETETQPSRLAEYLAAGPQDGKDGVNDE